MVKSLSTGIPPKQFHLTVSGKMKTGNFDLLLSDCHISSWDKTPYGTVSAAFPSIFFWAIAFVLVAITHLQSLELFLQEYPHFVRSHVRNLPWTYFGSTITLGGILISGYFVYNVRRNYGGAIANDT